jgi:hypothetical protein
VGTCNEGECEANASSRDAIFNDKKEKLSMVNKSGRQSSWNYNHLISFIFFYILFKEI